ncbi:uncharacterized protein SPPG_06671 [Spizellomyces punctatus DAOM BR117]|uniref:Uncharacterized protein n=1 Tax=Spizellomyces punctatus (strain DAOM BR117) TaxID=645134 RepID=A0A0L0HBY5_SPIPD|nr:uncharacterized protein SPPG_06671 [Spizellomyces punctatus DAOM BR117]KNC98273.1 hypothetical protein SPPG_06671 [Spizellomyces punctatus DAOM BR117]|eukprot:XP_016606313.1 hypothetical protein SPPG_06671 [Spizellomyces punctatus DAOM BR117]
MNNESRNVSNGEPNNDSTVALTNVDNTTSGMQGESWTHRAAEAHGEYTGTAFVDRGQAARSSQDNSVRWVTVETVSNNDNSAKRNEKIVGPQVLQCVENETMEARRENRGDRSQLEWRRRMAEEGRRLHRLRQREKHESINQGSVSYYNLRSRTVRIRSLSPEGDRSRNGRRRSMSIPIPDNDVNYPWHDGSLTNGNNQSPLKKHGSGKKGRQSRLRAVNIAEFERERYANRKMSKADKKKAKRERQLALERTQIMDLSQQVFTAASFKGKPSGGSLFIPPGMADAASMSSFDEPVHPKMAVPLSAAHFSSSANNGDPNIDYSDGKPIPIPRNDHLTVWDPSEASHLLFGTNGAGAPLLGKRKERSGSQSPIDSRKARRALEGSASS